MQSEFRSWPCAAMIGRILAQRTARGTRGMATASRVRPNKRVARTSEATTLSSLISLYHLTPTFPPLSPALIKPHIISAFLPATSFNAPVPRDQAQMLYAKRRYDSASASFDRSGGASSLLAADYTSNSEYNAATPTLQSFEQSFLQTHTKGFEHAFRKRARMVVDTLHGTSAGGQAGLGSLLEHTHDTLEDIEVEKMRALDLATEREALELQARARLDEEDQNFEGGFIDEEDPERR